MIHYACTHSRAHRKIVSSHTKLPLDMIERGLQGAALEGKTTKLTKTKIKKQGCYLIFLPRRRAYLITGLTSSSSQGLPHCRAYLILIAGLTSPQGLHHPHFYCRAYLIAWLTSSSSHGLRHPHRRAYLILIILVAGLTS